jgi:hypothetical protein
MDSIEHLELIGCLNLILNFLPTEMNLFQYRNGFFDSKSKTKPLNIDADQPDLVLLHGFKTIVRAGMGCLLLNIDTAVGAFYDSHYLVQIAINVSSRARVAADVRWTESLCAKFLEKIKGLTVETIHGQKRLVLI